MNTRLLPTQAYPVLQEAYGFPIFSRGDSFTG